MSQLALVYAPTYSGAEAWQAQLEVIRAAVTHLTAKEVQDALDIAKSTLSQALHEQADKRWAAEWTHVLMAMLAKRYDDVSMGLLRQLVQAGMAVTSFDLADGVGLTPEQERDMLRAELAALGEQGKAAIDRVRRKGKKGR